MRSVSRLESMSPRGMLCLHIQDDGDVIVSCMSDPNELDGGSETHIEICTPFSGGGGSRRTHLALLILARSMALDNADPEQDGRKGHVTCDPDSIIVVRDDEDFSDIVGKFAAGLELR